MTRTDKSSIGDRSSDVKTCLPNPAFPARSVSIFSPPAESPGFYPSNFQFGLVKLEHICYKLFMIDGSLSPHQLFHAPYAFLEQPSDRTCFISINFLHASALFVPLFLLYLLIEPRSISLSLIPYPLSLFPSRSIRVDSIFTPIQSSPTSPNWVGLKIINRSTIPARPVTRRV